jgi:hypothetical protein
MVKDALTFAKISPRQSTIDVGTAQNVECSRPSQFYTVRLIFLPFFQSLKTTV